MANPKLTFPQIAMLDCLRADYLVMAVRAEDNGYIRERKPPYTLRTSGHGLVTARCLDKKGLIKLSKHAVPSSTGISPYQYDYVLTDLGKTIETMIKHPGWAERLTKVSP